MEQNKEKITHILQYYYDKGKNASHAANKICAVYGPDTVSISTAQRWFQRFCSGADPFLKRMVTGDEKCVTYDNVKRKR